MTENRKKYATDMMESFEFICKSMDTSYDYTLQACKEIHRFSNIFSSYCKIPSCKVAFIARKVGSSGNSWSGQT
jgi:hypothetical protein